MKQFKIIAALALAFCAFASFADRLANHRYVNNKFAQENEVVSIEYDRFGTPYTNVTICTVFRVDDDSTKVAGLEVSKNSLQNDASGKIVVKGGGELVAQKNNIVRIIDRNGVSSYEERGFEGVFGHDKLVLGGVITNPPPRVPGITIPGFEEDKYDRYGAFFPRHEVAGFFASSTKLTLLDVLAFDGNHFFINQKKSFADMNGNSYIKESKIEGNHEGITITNPKFYSVEHHVDVFGHTVHSNEVTIVKPDYTSIRSGNYTEKTDRWGITFSKGEARISSNGFACGNRVSGSYDTQFDVEVRTNGFFVGGVDITTYITASDGTKFRAINNGGSLSWEVVE